MRPSLYVAPSSNLTQTNFRPSVDINCIVVLMGRIDLLTVVCLVTWPLNESEAGVDKVNSSLIFIHRPGNYTHSSKMDYYGRIYFSAGMQYTWSEV